MKFAVGVYLIVPSGLTLTVPLPAVTDVMVNGSESGSVSLASTLMLADASSFNVTASSWAVGAGFDTDHVKLVATVAPCPSLAVTVTVYGPVCEAFLSMVPEITPPALMLSPGGNPVAENVNVSVVSTSANEAAALNEITCPSWLMWSARPVVAGASLTLAMFTVTVVVSVVPAEVTV